MGGKEKRQPLGEVNRYAAVDWGWGVGQVYCCNRGRTEHDGEDRRLPQLGLDIKQHLSVPNPRSIKALIFICSKPTCVSTRRQAKRLLLLIKSSCFWLELS